MRQLAVWCEGRLVGTFAQGDDGKQSFGYAPEWLAAPQPFAISLSMPLGEQPFGDRIARAFFGGLLPDDELRRRLARLLQVSPRNEFALLAVIGRECAGALSLLPALEPPPSTTRVSRRLDEAEFGALLRELPDRPLLAGKEVRLSLAGAQDKIAVRLVEGAIHLPLDGAPTTHIVKTPIAGFAETVVNEFFSMTLARAAGLPAAGVQLRVVDGMPVLFVERFDRLQDAAGQVQRVHQEDFCQALAIAPELKYQAEGGPGLVQMFDVLSRHSLRAALDRLLLLEMVVFHFLLGNADAHAKNFSLLLGPRGVRLAPVYDAMCTLVYPALSPRLAMKIGSRREFDEVGPEHWTAFARQVGLSPAIVTERLQRCATRLPGLARELAAGGGPFASSEVVGRIVAGIDARCQMALGRGLG